MKDINTFLENKPWPAPIPRADVPVGTELGIYWRDENTFVEAVFEGQGTYYYYAERSENGVVKDKDSNIDIDVTQEWPRKLVEFLTYMKS